MIRCDVLCGLVLASSLSLVGCGGSHGTGRPSVDADVGIDAGASVDAGAGNGDAGTGNDAGLTDAGPGGPDMADLGFVLGPTRPIAGSTRRSR